VIGERLRIARPGSDGKHFEQPRPPRGGLFKRQSSGLAPIPDLREQLKRAPGRAKFKAKKEIPA
jgi:hypothetical protein